jgi:hypothetical protein
VDALPDASTVAALLAGPMVLGLAQKHLREIDGSLELLGPDFSFKQVRMGQPVPCDTLFEQPDHGRLRGADGIECHVTHP